MGIENNPSLEKFQTPDALAKSYTELERYSLGALRVPQAESSAEDKEAFFAKLEAVDGVMRTPENYSPPPADAAGYSFDEVEGFTGDESVGALKAAAKELGLSTAQANGIHKFLATNVVANEAAGQAANETAMADIKGQWGTAFDHKVLAAENTVAVLAQKIPGLKDAERTPEFLQLMDLVGGMLGEGKPVQQDPRSGTTRSEAREKIAAIESNHEHPAHPSNEGSRGYDAARAELMKLYVVANG